MILNSEKISNTIVAFYLSTILIIGMIANNAIITVIFYFAFFIAVIFTFVTSRRLRLGVFIISAGGFLCGILGICVNGNSQILNLLYMVFSIYVAIILANPKVNYNIFYYSAIITALIIIVKIARNGINSSIFPESSVNYISVFLMLSICLYYARADLYEKEYSLVPALISFALTIIAGGRGGFLALSVLVIPLILIKFFSKKRSGIEKVLLAFFLLFVVVVVGYPLILRIVNNTDIILVNNFQNKASLTNSYRYYCWLEYLERCRNTWKELLFGVKISTLKWANILNGNLHNSYLTIHAYYGIFGVLFVIIQTVRTMLFLLKAKKWVYLFSLLSFEIRAFTDHLFAANRMSPIFLAMLLAPSLVNYYCCSNSKTVGCVQQYSIKLIQ